MSEIDQQIDPRVGTRRYAVGAELVAPNVVSFRVWAPAHERVRVLVDGTTHEMSREHDGYFRVEAPGRAGSRYGFLLTPDDAPLPDPASRFQPDGPHGLSAVVDPSTFTWHDAGWNGVTLRGQVIYEFHVGTFTREGTWRAAAPHLARLRDLGITVVQMMPVGDFPGNFGWGYDGVDWFAPTRLYGRPDDLRQLVDDAHRIGMAVTLDVVYNHFGPSGNYLGRFASDYCTDRHPNEWGAAINYDGDRSGPVRELVLANVEHWIREFHFDGLRLDATHAIFDDSDDHILAALVRRARQAAAPRNVIILAESETQEVRLIRPVDRQGFGLDGIYSEDFQHTARVALTGQRESYYTDYAGTAEELAAAARWGTLFQGQFYSSQAKRRGSPALDRPPEQFVACLENHDQVANSSTGQRLVSLAAPGALRALTALVLLGPCTPMLFQGQEYGSTRPFLFFVDHDEELTALVRAGRQQFLSQFPRYAPAASETGPHGDMGRSAFEASTLDHEAHGRGETSWWTLHRDLIRLRQRDPVFAGRTRPPEATTLDDRVLLLRDITESGDDRLLVVNLGTDFDLARAIHPLVAPPDSGDWHVSWSSESLEYGGAGMPAWKADRWPVPGRSALVLAPRPA